MGKLKIKQIVGLGTAATANIGTAPGNVADAGNLATPSFQRFSVADANATVGQTTFTVATYTPGALIAFFNGVKLPTSAFTATNGTSVVLVDALQATDTLEVLSWLMAGVQNAAPISHQHQMTDLLGTLPVAQGGLGNGTGDASGLSVTATGGTAARTNASRAADLVCVKDQGAVLDGVADDTAAFNRARGAVLANAEIRVPAGGFNITVAPTSGPPAGQVLWHMCGTAYGTGTSPVYGIGDDTVETVAGGGRWLRRLSSAQRTSTLRVDGVFQSFVATTGAVSGNTVAASEVNAYVTAPPSATSFASNYTWAFRCNLYDSHIGPAQNVAGAFTAFRNSGALADGYGPRGPLFGFNAVVNDQTNASADLSGPLVAQEIDVYANGDDPSSFPNGGNRVGLHIVIGRSNTSGYPARVGRGLEFGSQDTSFYGRCFAAPVQWDTAAIDLSAGSALAITVATQADQGGAGKVLVFPYTVGIAAGMYASGTSVGSFVQSVSNTATTTTVTLSNASSANVPSGTSILFKSQAPAILLAADQRIAFTAGNTRALLYNSVGQQLQYQINGIGLAGITDNGTLFGASLKTSVSATVAAGGTTQGTATGLSSDISVVTSGTGGVLLRSGAVGTRQEVLNRSGSAITVYPPGAAQIEGGAINAGVSLASGGHAVFIAVSATQFYQAP